MARQAINIVFDGPPGPEAGRFIEVETDGGASINVGKWVERENGWWALRITELPSVEPATTAAKTPHPINKSEQMREYEMTDEQLAAILDAGKPVPLIMLQCGMPPSPQENANRAWVQLGEEMGFDYMTVRPATGKSDRFFTARPTEPVNA